MKSFKELLGMAGVLAVVSVANAETPLVIGGFDTERSGHISFPAGDYFSQARASLTTSLGPVVFKSFPTLTYENLDGLDIVVLAPGTTHSTAATPLSASEQNALRQYALAGGGVVILADNYSYSTGALAEETALLAPFGMEGYGTLQNGVWVTVPNPENHAVTSGRFGTVSEFTQFFPGGISHVGPWSHALATNALGVALTVIEPGVLGEDSGRVAVYSDGNSFADDANYGAHTQNRILFLNTMDWVRRTVRKPRLLIEQHISQMVVSWSTNSTGFRLLSSPRLGPPAEWSPVTNAVTIMGVNNTVTLDAAEQTRFFQLVNP